MAFFDWIDGLRKTWRIELLPDHVILRGDGGVELDFARPRWAHDIFVSRHGEQVLIRFDTFEGGANFLVPAPAAEPLLRHIAIVPKPEAPTLDDAIPDPVQPARPLLWPKVSPLAVWSLICSALVFLPIVGVLPAIATIVLLLLHRRRVRAAPVYRHSRILCRVAVAFLIFGLGTSALATIGAITHMQRAGMSLSDWPLASAAARRSLPSGPAEDHASASPEPWQARRTVDAAASTSAPVGLLGEAIWNRSINWGYVVAALIAILFSLSVHEAAHAITAWWLGDDFARRLGRVTLNPLMHIDPVGTVLLPAIMAFMNGPIFGWARPVPVRLEYVPNPRRASVLVSIAGPGSNLLIASLSLTLMLAIGTVVSLLFPGTSVGLHGVDGTGADGAWSSALESVFTILSISFTVNIVLAVFNMIPLPPLDGSWVLAALFPQTVGQFYMRIRPYSFLIFIMLIYSDVLRHVFTPVGFLIFAPAQVLLQLATGDY